MSTLEITIQRKVGDTWPVVAEYRQSDAFLPVHTTGTLSIDDAALNTLKTALDYGVALGQALFKDDIRDALTRAMASSDEALRVLLFVEAPALNSLRWERLCGPIDGRWDFMAMQQRLLFTLHLPSHTDRRFPPIGRRDLRALIVVANPTGLGQYGLSDFDAAATAHSVKEALGEIPADILGPQSVKGALGLPTAQAIIGHINAQHYTLLHVVAHGKFLRRRGETVIYLSDDHNGVDIVSAADLIDGLARLRSGHGLPHFAFFCTCESALPEAEGALGGLGQRFVRDLGMPAVIAMTDLVSIESAGLLSNHFYRHLREHGEVDRAFAQAYVAVADRPDITVPALYGRLGGRPLFSDSLDRALTNKEIAFGLEQAGHLLDTRAPILKSDFDRNATRLSSTLGAEAEALSKDLQSERQEALIQINVLCQEVFDLNFNALALGQSPPPYDDRPPFLGLVAFRAKNKAFFFGREKLVSDLTEKLAGQNSGRAGAIG